MSVYLVVLFGERRRTGEEYIIKSGYIREKEDLDLYGGKVIVNWFSDTETYDIYLAQKITRIRIEEVIL